MHHEQCLTECCKRGSRPGPHQMANFSFSLQFGINHTCGQKNGQLGCCLCFPNGTWGDGSRAPCPGPFQDGKAGRVCLGSGNQPHVGAHVSFQGSQLEMLDAITGSIAPKIYLTFYKSFAWVCAGTPMQKEMDKPCAILCAQHILLALFKLQPCSWAEADNKGSMTESHGDQGEKSRAPRPKAELLEQHPQPEIWKERRFLGDTPNLTAGDPVGHQGPRAPSQLSALPLLQRSTPSCASRGADFSQGKASSNSMAAFQLTSAPSRLPVHSAAISSSNIQMKWFSMNLSGPPALLQAMDQQWAQLSPCALAHPCLAPNPTGVIPQLPAGSRAAWKAWLHRQSAIHTLLKGE